MRKAFLTDQGKKDKLLKGMPESIRVLLGHKEACDSLPPGCVLLATNELIVAIEAEQHRLAYAQVLLKRFVDCYR